MFVSVYIPKSGTNSKVRMQQTFLGDGGGRCTAGEPRVSQAGSGPRSPVRGGRAGAGAGSALDSAGPAGSLRVSLHPVEADPLGKPTVSSVVSRWRECVPPMKVEDDRSRRGGYSCTKTRLLAVGPWFAGVQDLRRCWSPGREPCFPSFLTEGAPALGKQ